MSFMLVLHEKSLFASCGSINLSHFHAMLPFDIVVTSNLDYVHIHGTILIYGLPVIHYEYWKNVKR